MGAMTAITWVVRRDYLLRSLVMPISLENVRVVIGAAWSLPEAKAFSTKNQQPADIRKSVSH